MLLHVQNQSNLLGQDSTEMISTSTDPYGGAGPLILRILWAEAILATIIVSARAYTAFHLLEHSSWDVFWAAVAWVRLST